MHEIRIELDDLSFQVLEPDIRDSIITRLKLLRSQDEQLFDKIQKKIEELLKKNDLEFEIFGRENSILYLEKDENKICKLFTAFRYISFNNPSR